MGPAEAGKSTLVAAVLARRAHSEPRSIDARLLARRLRGSAGRPRPGLLALASRHPAVADLLLGAPHAGQVQAALLARSEQWAGFLAAAVPRRTTSMLDVLALRWTLEALATRALIECAREAVPRGTIALLDEGPTHPYRLAPLMDPDEDPIDSALLAHVPLPDVLVHVLVDRQVLAERMRRRRDRAPQGAREASWGDDAALVAEAGRSLEVAAHVARIARSRGVPVVEVDGGLPPDEGAVIIASAVAPGPDGVLP